jgi:hypothetical protein
MALLARKLLFPPSSGPNIQFVGGSISSKEGASSGDTTLALNSGLTGGIASGVSTDDFVIGIFATGSTADRTLAITDGTNPYTLIASELISTDNYFTNLRVAYKFMGGTPDTSLTFGPTGSSSDAGVYAAYCFRGVDKTTPLDVTPTTATGNNATSPNPPSITPSTLGAFIVAIGAGADDMLNTDTLSTSGLTGFIHAARQDTNGSIMGVGHKNDWTSGAFDPAVMTSSYTSAAGSWAAMTIALRPA